MRKHRPDITIPILVLLLLGISLVVIYAIGPRVVLFENSLGADMSENHYFARHLPFILLTICSILAMYFIPYEKIRKIGRNGLFVGLGLCLIVAILGKAGANIVLCDEGACRAFRLPGLGVGFQPVEIVKIGVLFYFSWLIRERRAAGLLDSKEFFLPTGIIFGAVALIVGIFLKDFGSTMVITAMMTAMALIGGVSPKRLGQAAGIIGICVVALIIVSPHRLKRLASFSGSGDSYHIENSLIGMGTGGLLGVGLGNTIQTTGYLPEAPSDSIFPVIGEAWGIFGTTFVLLLYVLLLARILHVAECTEDKEQSLVVVGVFAWIASHVIINVGGMTGLMPMKGITLPFLSYGGTSLVFLGIAIGFVLQISGWMKRKKVDEDFSSGRGQRRSRYTSNRSR